MSRKVREVAQARSTNRYEAPGCLVASLGYSSIKPTQLPDDVAIVLWLPETEVTPRPDTLAERLGSVLPAIQRVLMNGDAATAPPTAIFVIDCTQINASSENDLRSIVDAETEAGGALGKKLGKPVGRFLEKLLCGYRGRVTLVAFGGGAQLALRLLQADPSERGIKEGVVKRLVLLRPRLSAAAIYVLLSKPSTKAQNMDLDVYYESTTALEKRDVMLRHAYARGTSHVLTAASGGANCIGTELCVSLLCNSSDCQAVEEGALVDPEALDSMGRSVFWSELYFAMHKETKQQEAVQSDLDVYELARAATPTTTQCDCCPSTAALAGNGAEQQGSEGTDCVGALVLRGNRCVLVRSLASPPVWSGMRIPFVQRSVGESALDGAIRAAAEHCDCDTDELELLPYVPPAVLYLDDGRTEQRSVLIYALYAVSAPPPGPLENVDMSDDEELCMRAAARTCVTHSSDQRRVCDAHALAPPHPTRHRRLAHLATRATRSAA